MVLVNKNTAAEVLAAAYDEENGVIRTSATIDGSDIQLGAIELKDGATDTRAKVGAVNALVATDIGLPVASYPVASEVHMGEVGGKTVPVQTSFTRPSDANDYAANDAVSNSTSATTVMTFTGAARVSGGSGYIVRASVIHEKASVTPRMRLHLYNATPGTVFNDNATFANTYAIESAASYLGYIDFDAMASNGSTDSSKSQNETVRKPFKCNADANLYGLLQTLDAFTPGNAKGFTVKLMIEQN